MFKITRAEDAERQGNIYPLLTLRMGIAFHQVMVDVCDEFAGRANAGAQPQAASR